MRKSENIITKIAMRKAKMETLYDKELEKKILAVLREKKSKVYEIKRIKDILDFI